MHLCFCYLDLVAAALVVECIGGVAKRNAAVVGRNVGVAAAAKALRRSAPDFDFASAEGIHRGPQPLSWAALGCGCIHRGPCHLRSSPRSFPCLTANCSFREGSSSHCQTHTGGSI